MIEYDVWIEGISGICELVADKDSMNNAWLAGDDTITSIMDYDELYEQVFDDLDADDFEKNRLPVEEKSLNRQKLISKFLESIRLLDKKIEVDSTLKKPLKLLNSSEWSYVRESALGVVNEFKRQVTIYS